MPNTTNGLKSIEAGGTITLNDGTTTWTLLALEPGTFFWNFGGFVPKPWGDRGIRQMPYKGDQRSGKLGFKGKYAGAQAANDLPLALQRQDAAISTMLAWSIGIDEELKRIEGDDCLPTFELIESMRKNGEALRKFAAGNC